jgi:hypothetical protein
MYTADDVCYLILQHGGYRQLDVARKKREITDTRTLAFYHLLSIPSYSKDPGDCPAAAGCATFCSVETCQA